MGDSTGHKLDGVSLDKPFLATHGLAIPHRVFQPHELTIGAIMLPEANCDRGWPEREQATRVDPVRGDSLQQLRSIVRDVVTLASCDAALFSRKKVQVEMQESLLGAIDHAFATACQESSIGLATRNYVRICRRAVEFLNSTPKNVSSNAEIATAVGVTIRTLHNAMVAVNGMSLQRFLTLRRLWAVRDALACAGSTDRVKAIALDHGFWHIGRFSQTYRRIFGETPSDTLRCRVGRVGSAHMH